MARRKRVQFSAKKMVPKKVEVSFRTTRGRKVSFTATKKVPKRVKVDFYAKKRKK